MDAPVEVVQVQGLERELGVLVHRIRRAGAERARMVHPDLTSAAMLVLGHLAAVGSARGADLVADLALDKATVSRQIRHLEELGLVSREPDADDGRAWLIGLTGAARARLAEVDRTRRDRLVTRLAGWTGPELDAFVAELGRYNRSLA